VGLGLSSIVNTLAGLDPRTLAEAAAEEERKRLAAQTSSAVGQAEQAGSAYQQAVATPPIDPGLAEFFPALLANIASVIGEEPAYREQGQKRAEQSRATSLKLRADNLQALRDIWGQKAEAAQKAGDLEMEEKARSKREQISRVWEGVKLNAEHAGKLELADKSQAGDIAVVQERGAQERATQAAGAKLVKASERTALTRAGVDPDTGLTLKTFALRELSRGEALAKGRDEKLRNEAYNSMWRTATDRWSSDKTPRDMGNRLLNMRHPFYKGNAKEARYFLTDEKVFRKVKGQWVKDPDSELRAKARAREVVMPYFQGE
jgi:hypothetical protein